MRQKPVVKTSLCAGRRIGLAVLFTVVATDGLQNAIANGDTRALTIHHTHTRENINVVFKRNGRYDEAGVAKLNYFLRDWRNNEQTKMDLRLFDIVWEVYQDVGGKEPIQIISAYRSPQTNSMLRRRSRGVAKHSQHMLGKAMDFNIPGVSLDRIRAAGLRLQRGGVGFYPSSGSPFVHLDVGSVRHWPRMSPEALAKVFPDGRTVHIPSNGRPLSGYALALADVSRRSSASDETPSAFKKPGWFGRVLANLNGGKDQDEDAGEQPAPARSRLARAQDRVQEKPAQVAMAAVPMPRARPGERPNPDAVLMSGQASPSQIIQARGIWTGKEALAAAAATAKARESGPRLAWQVGAQPVTNGDSTLVTKRVPAPRPRPEVAMASVTAAESAEGVPWPIADREDRVPSDLVLAFASSTSAPETDFRLTSPAPMGSLRPPALAQKPVAKSVAKTPALTPRPARTGSPVRLVENPWLRGVMLAPSVTASMGVTVLGILNYRELAQLMRKPPSAIANSFADRPEFGLNSEAFRGPAVSFVPTVTFGMKTAGLN